MSFYSTCNSLIIVLIAKARVVEIIVRQTNNNYSYRQKIIFIQSSEKPIYNFLSWFVNKKKLLHTFSLFYILITLSVAHNNAEYKFNNDC